MQISKVAQNSGRRLANTLVLLDAACTWAENGVGSHKVVWTPGHADRAGGQGGRLGVLLSI